MDTRGYIILAVIIFIAFFIGFSFGTYATIKSGIIVAKHFLNVSLDYDMVNKAIFQYNNNINSCFFAK